MTFNLFGNSVWHQYAVCSLNCFALVFIESLTLAMNKQLIYFASFCCMRATIYYLGNLVAIDICACAPMQHAIPGWVSQFFSSKIGMVPIDSSSIFLKKCASVTTRDAILVNTFAINPIAR